MKTLIQSLWTALSMTLILGLAYPLAMTGAAQVLFPAEANGSLVRGATGAVVGSSLVGQDWSGSASWFQGRPSATSGDAYNPLASGGSNLSPQGRAYADRVAASRLAWEPRAREAGQTGPIPGVLLATSGSGLDPHLDLEAVLWQVPLVAKARGVDQAALEKTVRSHALSSPWPWDPSPYVNLLELNMDVERQTGKR